MKGKPHKYSNTIFEMYKLKSGYVCTLEMYTGTNPADTDFNSYFNVINRLCSLVENRGHTMYMDRWFSSPKLFDNLWACNTKAVDTVMPNRKIPKQAFSNKLKKGEKTVAHRGHLMVIKWRDLQDVYSLTTAHDEVTEVQSSGGTQKNKADCSS
jgi:hypothetical protein